MLVVHWRSGQQDDDGELWALWAGGRVCSGWAKEAEPVPRCKKLNHIDSPVCFSRSPSCSEKQDGARPETDASLRRKSCASPKRDHSSRVR